MRPALGLLLLFVGFACLFGVFAKGHVDNGDALQSLYAARSLHLRGDLGLPPELDEHTAPAERVIPRAKNGMRGANGSYYVWFPVGHQLLLVPAAVLGTAADDAWPEVAKEASPRLWGGLFWAQFFASWIPILCAGGAAVVLFLLARELGCSVRGGVLVALVSTCCTQFWPMMVENLSDGPGQLLLLAAALQAVRSVRGTTGVVGLIWCGVWCGLAVLMRYPHALSVCVLGGFVLYAAFRRGGLRTTLTAAGALAVGGLPWGVILLTANYLRFGDVFETGYGAADLGNWFSYPIWLGLLFIFGAFAKGILWLSPPLAPALWWGRPRSLEGWLVLSLFAAPILLFANTDGWQAGPVWGIRYVAPGVILAIAYGLSVARPWTGRARPLFAGIAVLGLLASLTGHLAPARGFFGLAAQATEQHYLDQGIELEDGAAELHYFVEWRFSPLHGNWTYALQNLRGRMDEGGSKHVTEPIFGVKVPDVPRPVRPSRYVDREFRHWWWVWLGECLGRSLWWVVALFGLIAAAALWGGSRILQSAQVPDAMGSMEPVSPD